MLYPHFTLGVWGGHTQCGQGLHLALCLAITPGRAQGTTGGAGTQSRVSCVQVKCLTLSGPIVLISSKDYLAFRVISGNNV